MTRRDITPLSGPSQLVVSGKVGWTWVVIFRVVQADFANLGSLAAAMGESTVVLVMLPR
jgi:hypothetical protein